MDDLSTLHCGELL